MAMATMCPYRMAGLVPHSRHCMVLWTPVQSVCCKVYRVSAYPTKILYVLNTSKQVEYLTYV